MPESDVLDPEMVAALRAYEKDGIVSVRELTDAFLSDIGPRVEAIAQALKKANAHDLHKTAHALKGAAGNVGAFRLRDICQCLEDKGKAKTTDSTADLFAALQEEIPRVEKALKDLCAD